jgi:hypothetical protein
MVGWLRRIFGGKPVAEASPVAAVAPAAQTAATMPEAPAPKPVAPPYVPNLPNLAGLAAQALSEHSRPLPVPEPPAPAEMAPVAPPVPVLGADEKLVLLQVARGSNRRARPAVAAALQGIIGDRPNLNRVPNRGQVTRALHRLQRDPAKVAALLEQVEMLAGAARRR